MMIMIYDDHNIKAAMGILMQKMIKYRNPHAENDKINIFIEITLLSISICFFKNKIIKLET